MGGGQSTNTKTSNPVVQFAPTATGGGNISIGGNVATGGVTIGGNTSSGGATTDVKADVKVTPTLLILQNLVDTVTN